MADERRQGRRRLAIVLGAVSAGLMATLMAVVLVFYGAPYSPVWWAVMAVILVVAYLAPRFVLVPAVEWVMAGYAADDGKR